jgi:glycosyltransferase involved in cell wall biosynthesis
VNWGRAGWLAAAVRSRVMALAYAPAWKRIASEQDAVVHIGLNCSGLVPPEMPLVYECVDSTLTQLGTRHYIRAAGRRCIVHCQTERIRRTLVAIHEARQPRWRTEVSPCYFAAYTPTPASDQRDPGLVAFLGRFSPEKNPLLFVEALARARAQGAPVRGLMLGEGPLRTEIEARARDLGIGGHLEIDFVAEPAARLARAGICVGLQSGDNYGSQALLEAMGAGCAIVASDVGETRRLVTPETGLCCPLDVEAVAGALARLVGDIAGTAAMGAAAAKRARTEFSAAAYVAFVESLYDDATAYFPLPPNL